MRNFWLRQWASLRSYSNHIVSNAAVWLMSASGAMVRPALLVAIIVVIVPVYIFAVQHASKATPVASNWYVAPASAPSPTGNDSNSCSTPSAPCATFAGAMGKALNGDTIIAAQGTYNEEVTVTKQLTIEGNEHGVDARTRPTTSESIVTNTCGPFQIEADHVTIDGFTIEGATSTSASCFFVGVWTNPGFSGTHGGEQIINNIIQNNISGIEFDNDGTFAALVQFNLIQNNNNPGPGSGNGIETDFGLINAEVDSNKFSGDTSSSFVIEAPSSALTVSNNILAGGANEGFAFADLTGSTSANSITGNKSEGTAATAIIDLFGGDSAITISGNELEFGKTAILVENPFSVGTNSSITIGTNNCISGNSVAGLNVETGTYTGGANSLNAMHNWWGAATGPTIATNPTGTGDKIIDPDGVVDYSNFLTTSPCAAPNVVNTILDNTISGDGMCTLREAIINANAGTDMSGGDCQVTSDITFSVDGTITLGSTLPAITGNVTIDGTGHSITVDGATTFQVLVINSGAELDVANLTIAHGSAATGGAISNSGILGVNLTTFSNNSATDEGGAIFNNGTQLNVSNSTFSHNNQTTASVGPDGGAGIFTDAGITTITGSTFDTNSAQSNGGAIYAQSGSPTVTITNSTFSGNVAGASGGAVDSIAGTISLLNCTLSGNTAMDGAGGGGVVRALSGAIKVANTILNANNPDNCGGTILNGNYNISSDASCSFGMPASPAGANGQTLGDEVNPLLNALANNGGPTETMSLQAGSPAIDAVPIASCPKTDQRGAPRQDPGDSPTIACDVGAFESGNALPTPSATATLTATATPTATTTPSMSPTTTVTVTATATPSISVTATTTVTATVTASPSVSTTATATATPTSTATASMISLVGKSSTFTVTQTVPAGVMNGDLLLAFYADWHAPTSATAPPGWILFQTEASVGSGVITVWYKFATAGDTPGTNYIWTFSGPGPYESGGMLAYRGVDPNAPFDGSCNDEGSDNKPTLCGFSTNYSNDEYVGFFAMENINLTLPISLTTEILSQYNAGQYFGSAAGDRNAGGAGPQATVQGSMNPGGWEAIALALKAVNSGPTPVPTATQTPQPGTIEKIGATSTTSNVVTVPNGVANGDLLLAFFSYWSPATAAAPPGWTFLQHSINANSGTEAVWYRIANNDMPGSVYTWSFSGAGPYDSGGMLAYRGVDPAQVEDGNCEMTGHSTTPTLCSFSTAFNNDEYVGLFATENTGFTFPGDLTEEVLLQYTNGQYFGSAAGDKTLGASGPTGIDAGGMNNGGWASIALALKPLNAGPPGPTPIPPPITFIGSSASANATLTVPAGTQTGDLLLAFFSYWHFATATPPAGWTQLETEPSASSGVETVWYRFATAGDTPGTNYIWNFTGQGPYASGGMLTYRGVAAAPFLDQDCLDSGNNNSPTLCGVNTTASNDIYVGFYCTENTNLVLPGDLTSRVLQQYASGSFFGSAAADKQLGATGVVAADTGSMNSGGWETVLVTLKHQ